MSCVIVGASFLGEATREHGEVDEETGRPAQEQGSPAGEAVLTAETAAPQRYVSLY